MARLLGGVIVVVGYFLFFFPYQEGGMNDVTPSAFYHLLTFMASSVTPPG